MSNQSSTLLHKMQCRTYSRSRLPACIKGIARAISLAPLIVSLSLSSAGFTPAIAGAYDADQLLIKNQFKQAEEQYRGQLDEDTTGDAYAGLAVALAKQGTPAKVTTGGESPQAITRQISGQSKRYCRRRLCLFHPFKDRSVPCATRSLLRGGPKLSRSALSKQARIFSSPIKRSVWSNWQRMTRKEP